MRDVSLQQWRHLRRERIQQRMFIVALVVASAAAAFFLVKGLN